MRETRGFLNNLYWWPLVEVYVLNTKNPLLRLNDAKQYFITRH